MILAAGLGTRLRPLTNDKPKALVEVSGIPLLEIAITKLKSFGVKDIIINVHHFAGQIESFLSRKNNFNINIQISDERKSLLETGGGLNKAAWFFDDNQPFLLYNADILCNLDLKKLYEAHLNQPGALATLVVSFRPTSRYLIFNDKNLLCGWINVKTGEIKMPRSSTQLQLKAFSGIHVISPEIFDRMPKKETPFSIINTYLDAASTHDIYAFEESKMIWLDVGKKENLKSAAQTLKLIQQQG